MDRQTPREKGNLLEDAVRQIESTILELSPGFAEGVFRIEMKKIMMIAGVRHEIDIYVTASTAPAYEAIFIFECKNWEEKVGKNEIIVFSEKIKVANAQRGFFVAKSYTADAKAQAAGDPRMELRHASEIDPSAVMIPQLLGGLFVDQPRATVKMRLFESMSQLSGTAIVQWAASFTLNGVATDLRTYVNTWVGQARDTRCARAWSEELAEGEHILELADERRFEPGQVILDGRSVQLMTLTGTVPVAMRKPIVVSALEVATRGRLLTVQMEAQSPAVKIEADIVQLISDDNAQASGGGET